MQLLPWIICTFPLCFLLLVSMSLAMLVLLFVIGVSSILPKKLPKQSWGTSFIVTHYYYTSLDLPSFIKCHRRNPSGQCSYSLMSQLVWIPIFLIFIWICKKYFTAFCFISNTVYIFNEFKVKSHQGSFYCQKNYILT